MEEQGERWMGCNGEVREWRGEGVERGGRGEGRE